MTPIIPKQEFIIDFHEVCDDRYSELIPCLDKNLIYQMKLKLDLSLMEHYERHCSLPESHFNSFIPPTIGYKVGRACNGEGPAWAPLFNNYMHTTSKLQDWDKEAARIFLTFSF
uniref:Probable methyltransferase PMT3 n=1 Tax=Tanacetum cinerariifolium TaxID=118510 RepID=A0A699JJP8_TANCI|nr:probable methyltransferase PMT3 [Tanacetum cinerariifolium]